VAVALAMIVVYDATGVRRQAGMQAQTINILVEELLQGHPISEQHLREVLGHTPLEAMGGVLIGLVTATGHFSEWEEDKNLRNGFSSIPSQNAIQTTCPVGDSLRGRTRDSWQGLVCQRKTRKTGAFPGCFQQT
jgi:hypothetical protein